MVYVQMREAKLLNIHCCSLVAKACLTLGDPTGCGPPGSNVHGISYAGILGNLPVQVTHSSCPTLWPHELQHTRPPCPSPTPGVYPNSCPLSWWCHPAISSSVVPFSSCLWSFLASGSFQMSQLFASGGQSIGVSASTSALPMNTQDWSPVGWTGWVSLQSQGLSRVF